MVKEKEIDGSFYYICDKCNEPIKEEDWFYFNGEAFHKKCYKLILKLGDF